MQPDPARLRELLDYDPGSGLLTWRWRADAPNNWNAVFPGTPAFTWVGSGGYCYGYIRNRCYRAHRVIHAWVTGAWPVGQMDHIDGNRTNNKWTNLRLANPSQQTCNKRALPRKYDLPRGVDIDFSCVTRRYLARININGVRHHLGSFASVEEAHAAYLAAAEKLHGEYAYHLSRKGS